MKKQKTNPATRYDIQTTYGLKQFARVWVDYETNSFNVEILDEAVAEEEEAIYAFVVDDRTIRIGSSLKPLRMRFRSWAKDVTRRFQCTDDTKRMRTPKKEADNWKKFLPDGKVATIYGRKGTEICTPVGTNFSSYLSEESYLIRKHQPCLNPSKYR